MIKGQITKWAFEVGMEWMPADDHCRVPHFDDVIVKELEAFAKLVAAHERKAIAAMVKPLDESLADEILKRGNT
jgi:hypothetical protein